MTNRESAHLDEAGWPADEYSADLGHGGARIDSGDTTGVSRTLSHHEAPAVHERLGKSADRVSVLEPGTRLQQGSTYLDLERLEDGPFVALAGQQVADGQLIAAKKDLDYETWNELIGEEKQPGEESADESA